MTLGATRGAPAAARAARPAGGGARPAAASPLAALAWSEAQADARALSPGGDPRKLLAGGLAAADAAVVVLTAAAAWVFRHGMVTPPAEILYAVFLAMVLGFNAMQLSGAYTRHLADGFARQTARAFRAWFLVSMALLTLVFLTKSSEEYSRLWAVGWCALALAGFTVNRALALLQIRRLRRRGRLARTIAVVDLAGEGEALARRLQRHGLGEVHLVGVFEPRRSGHRRNGVEDLIALARLFRIDEVLVAVSGGRSGAGLGPVLRRLGTIPANVRLCPVLPELDLVPRGADLVCGNPVLTLYQRPISGWSRVGKRLEDLVLGSLLLAAAMPAMVLVAIAVKVDSPGPIIFRQQRHGFNNNAFGMFKFRTMTHGATTAPDVRQARRDDPRVTRVGRVLRRTSLDELPQLLNVLRGEMSLVGPRPHALAHNDEYAALIDDYLGRHRVQPGITGWAQINGLRGETDTLDKMRRRLECDLAYIDNWSILFDLRILAQTALTVPFHRNAY